MTKPIPPERPLGRAEGAGDADADEADADATGALASLAAEVGGELPPRAMAPELLTDGAAVVAETDVDDDDDDDDDDEGDP